MTGGKPSITGCCSNRSIRRAAIAQSPIDFGKIPGGTGAGMGGMGSGDWYRWQGKKATVEESLVVAMRDFRGRLFTRTRPARLLGPGPAAASLRSAIS